MNFDRIKYYIGDCLKKTTIFLNNRLLRKQHGKLIFFDSKKIKDYKITNKYDYLYPIFELNSNFKCLTKVGDNIKTFSGFYFLKSRKIGDKKAILLKLNFDRHWNIYRTIKNIDIPFSQKKNVCIWRGSATGSISRLGNRFELIEKYFKKFNVGFSTVYTKKYEKYLKPSLSIKEQLKYKYIISAEGNDVSTSLKWILESNSVPIMPKPTCESWLMEGLLKPFVHYIPVKNNWSDLDIMIEFCKKNDKLCHNIAMNGKLWMVKFKNAKNEIYLQKKLINIYQKFVKFKNKK